MPENSIASPHS